jgi:hypothetical protein
VQPYATEVAGQLHDACAKVGFFYIVGHECPAAVSDGVRAAARDWFVSKPAEEKEVGLVPLHHSRYFASHKHGSIDDSRMVHAGATNLTPGSEQPLQSKHIQLMTAGTVHVTKLTPPGVSATLTTAVQDRTGNGGKRVPGDGQ